MLFIGMKVFSKKKYFKEKILFLVDHKHRDLISNCLISYYLKKKGYEVYLRRLHENEVGLIRPDVVIENKLGRNPKYLKRIKSWKNQNIKIILIENEGINQWDIEEKKVSFYPDLSFFWNKNHTHKLDKSYEQKVLGSPRSDLLHKKFSSIFKSRKELENLYKINPDLKNITVAFHNSYEDLDKKKLHEMSKTRLHIYKEHFSFFHMVEHQKIARKKLIKFIENLLEKSQKFNLILKPHPNDNIKFWYKFKEKYPSVTLMYGAPINDLFCLSDLHVGKSGCSTIPESYIYGLPNIELNFDDKLSMSILSKDHVNLGLQNTSDFKNLNYSLTDILEKKISSEIIKNYEKKMQNYINEHFHLIDGNRCKEYANYIDNFLNKNKKSKNVSKLVSGYHITLNFLSDFFVKYIKKLLGKYYKYHLIDKRGRYDSRIQLNDEKKYYTLFDKINLLD
mgnify:CR=1 FL=1